MFDQILAGLPWIRDIVLTAVPLYAVLLAHRRVNLADEQRAEDRARADRERSDYWHQRLYKILDRIHADETEMSLSCLNRISAIYELVDLANQQPEYRVQATGILERLDFQLAEQFMGDETKNLLLTEEGGTLEPDELDKAELEEIATNGGPAAKFLIETTREALELLDDMDEQPSQERD